MGMLKSLNVVNLYRVMSMLKLKINANLPHLLCIKMANLRINDGRKFSEIKIQKTRVLMFVILPWFQLTDAFERGKSYIAFCSSQTIRFRTREVFVAFRSTRATVLRSRTRGF